MTKSLARKSVQVSAIAAGMLLMAGGAAYADDTTAATAGNNGIANGNQVIAPIQAPIDACGNGVSALVGVTGAGCKGGSDATSTESGSDMISAANRGIGNGNQVQAPVQLPVNLCGNAVAVAGVSGAGCNGGSDATMESHSSEAANTEAGVPGVADVAPGGGQVGKTVGQTTQQLPAGDTVSGLTDSLPTSGLTGNSGNAKQQPPQQQPAPGAESDVTEQGGSGDMASAGNNGILNGTQIKLPVQAPIDVSGNAVGVLGVAGAGSKGGSSADMSGM